MGAGWDSPRAGLSVSPSSVQHPALGAPAAGVLSAPAPSSLGLGQCPSLAPGLIACPPPRPPQGLEQDVLQAIDRAIEAVHNAAMREGGKYSLEQRGVLQ